MTRLRPVTAIAIAGITFALYYSTLLPSFDFGARRMLALSLPITSALA